MIMPEKLIDTADISPQEEMGFLKAIRDKMGQFTPAQRLLSEYIIHNPESILFLSINELAKAAKTSQATIVRFCNLIGYDGYSQMTKDAQQLMHSQMSTAGRFKLAQYRRSNVSSTTTATKATSAFERILAHEQENLIRLANSVKVREFQRTADALIEADRAVIIGCMASASLAAHFGRMLGKVFPQVDIIDSEGVLESASLMRLTKKSIVFLLAFPRYPNATVKFGQAALNMGATIISITDSHLSPISNLGDMTFHIHVGIPSYVDAYAAPITFINALCAEIAERMAAKAVTSLDHYDRFVEDFNLFFKPVKRGRQNHKK